LDPSDGLARPHTTAPTETPQDEGNAQFSPDGKWIAHTSDETGRYEVFVVPFPSLGGKLQVSTRGGTEPRWRADGKELFYFDHQNFLTAVEITTTEGAFEAGKATALFQARETWLPGWGCRYDVSDDGQRFLLFVPVDETPPATISLILNWPAEFKQP
jgi:hypothetical protein